MDNDEGVEEKQKNHRDDPVQFEQQLTKDHKKEKQNCHVGVDIKNEIGKLLQSK